MPVPVQWRAEAQANAGAAATGTQTQPRIIGLSNGNILVAWREDAAGTVGPEGGTDIIGAIYGPDGTLLVDPFRLNTQSVDDNEDDPEIAATNDGGFVLVYVDDSLTNAATESVVLQYHDAGGAALTTHLLASNTAANTTYQRPSVAVDLTDNSLVVTWTTITGGVGDQVGRQMISPLSMGPEFDVVSSGVDERDGAIAVLANGDYVVVVEGETSTDEGVGLQIMAPDGSNRVAITFFDLGANRDPVVTGLADGNFVVAWADTDTGNGNIRFGIYDQFFNVVTAVQNAASGPNIQGSPTIAALPSGGFVLAWDDDTTGRLNARAFTALGATDGAVVQIDDTAVTAPDMTALADGRIAFSWINALGEISWSIWDPRGGVVDLDDLNRDLPNLLNGSVVMGSTGNDTLTGGAEDAVIDAREGDDSVTGGGGEDTITGGDGRDTLSGNGLDDVLYSGFGDDLAYGGNGDDLFQDDSGNDLFDGGNNRFRGDTVSYSLAGSGVEVYLMFTGLDVGGDMGIDTLTGIEHLIGTGFDDRLSGDAGANDLDGLSGNDVLNGKEGQDTLYGGGGDDKLTTGAAADILVGGAGSDSVFGLAGNDFIQGGTENDFLYGGRDDDDVFGEDGDDEVRGNIGNDNLQGLAGNDDLRGGAGIDDLWGGDGNDFLFGETGEDRLTGGTGDDTLTGGAGSGILDGVRDDFVYDTDVAGGGFDRVKDFEDGIDRLDLSGTALADFSAVLAISTDTATGLRIDLGGGHVLFVENFFLAGFDAGDVLL